MKRILAAALLAMCVCGQVHAQFEKGKKYVGASLTGFGMEYSDRGNLAMGLGLKSGYMIEDDWMLTGEMGFDYRNERLQSIFAGLGGRYYIEQNGLFLGLGARFVHEWKNVNDVQIIPEVGYCFFLGKTVTIEPSVFYGMSLDDFSKKSKVGLKIGFGFYF